MSGRKVINVVGDPDNKVILDLGCGFDIGISIDLIESASIFYAVDLKVNPSLADKYPNLVILKAYLPDIFEGYIPDILDQIPDASIDIVIAKGLLKV